MSEESAAKARFEELCTEIGEKAGYPPETVWLVFYACHELFGWGDEVHREEPPEHVGAEDVVRALLERVDHDYDERAEVTLHQFQLDKSEDVGRIVFALVEHGLIDQSPNDSPSDFDGLFDVERLDDALSRMGIRRRRRSQSKMTPLALVLFAAGAGTILAANSDVIPYHVGMPIGAALMIGGMVAGPLRS